MNPCPSTVRLRRCASRIFEPQLSNFRFEISVSSDRAELSDRLLPEHVAGEKPGVGGAFGEAAHEPREPIGAVRNEHAAAVARACEAELLGALDAVEHRELEFGLRNLLRGCPVG